MPPRTFAIVDRASGPRGCRSTGPSLAGRADQVVGGASMVNRFGRAKQLRKDLGGIELELALLKGPKHARQHAVRVGATCGSVATADFAREVRASMRLRAVCYARRWSGLWWALEREWSRGIAVILHNKLHNAEVCSREYVPVNACRRLTYIDDWLDLHRSFQSPSSWCVCQFRHFRA
jgi:hypothetical protein